MRMRRRPWAEAEIAAGRHIVRNAEALSGKWSGVFGNDNPVCVEIGMGKGKFIIEKALKNPCENYIGIERQLSVFASAAKKIRETEEKHRIENIRIAFSDAGLFPAMFAEDEISEIYINFCDPWPKKRCEKRRLTHRKYLSLYANALKKGGRLIFKTDNQELFLFTQNEISESVGWQNEAVSTDLHSEKDTIYPENVATEYEEKFAAMGKPIYRIAVINKKQSFELHEPEKNVILKNKTFV